MDAPVDAQNPLLQVVLHHDRSTLDFLFPHNQIFDMPVALPSWRARFEQTCLHLIH